MPDSGPGTSPPEPGTTAPPPVTTAGTSGTSGPSDDGGASESSTGTDGLADWVDDAKEDFPTFRALFDGYLERGCAAFENVCHVNNDYPDLAVAEDYLDTFGAACNADELATDPQATYERCEPVGDEVVLQTGPDVGWTGEIAFVTFEPAADRTVITLREALPSDALEATDLFVIVAEPGDDPADFLVFDATHEGDRVYVGNATADPELHMQLQTVIDVGDPNRNGSFGADDPMQELALGDLERSYLFARMVDPALGSVMPIANQEPDPAELGALACWIEQTLVAEPAAIDAPIDYDTCAYARD